MILQLGNTHIRYPMMNVKIVEYLHRFHDINNTHKMHYVGQK